MKHSSLLTFPFLLFPFALFAGPMATEAYVDRQDAKTYTNAVSAAKDYTDSAVVAAGAVTPSVVTDITTNVRIALANVTNVYGEAVAASDVGALPNSASGLCNNENFVYAVGHSQQISYFNSSKSGDGFAKVNAAIGSGSPFIMYYGSGNNNTNRCYRYSFTDNTADAEGFLPYWFFYLDEVGKLYTAKLRVNFTSKRVAYIFYDAVNLSMTTNDVRSIVTYKRDVTNNVCVVDSFTAWDFSKLSVTVASASLTLEEKDDGTWSYFLDAEYEGGGGYSEYVNESGTKSEMENRLSVSYEAGVITRSKAAYSNDTFTTWNAANEAVTQTVTKAYVEGLGIEAGVTSVNSKTGAVTLVASDVGAYSATSGATLQSQVATIGAHLNAEDARFVVTNYNSVTRTPEAYMEIKLPDSTWSRIWSEMTRWNFLYEQYLPTNYYGKSAVDAMVAEKADRAWGAYDSETGAYAPDDYTWISSKKIAIAANLAYQRTVTSEGAIWVLESNGTVTETGGTTNGFFRISDDEGNSLFEIVKGSKCTVGADPTNVAVVAGFTPTKLQIGYSVISETHPKISVCESLSNQLWKVETDAGCIANVVWSGSSGAWVAQVQGKAAYASMFVKASYETDGETLIRNTVPVSMQYIILNDVKYAVGTATISGNTVLTLTVAP